MTLEDAITEYAHRYIDTKNDWYGWRKINESKLPKGITLPDGNQYTKNIALKMQLNDKLKSCADSEEKRALYTYYISTWGGIHGNSAKTMNQYISSPNSQLLAFGSKGIASWSKALCIESPDEFAIFDARVSASLNAMQIISGIASPELFPLLTSRNKVISKGNKLFRNEAKRHSWVHADDSAFYKCYLEYLKKASSSFDRRLNVSIATIEMLLFAKAEDLVKQAFPNGGF